MATTVKSLNIQPDLKQALADVASDLANVSPGALVTDVAAIRAQVVALVTDMTTRISEFNTLTTKLNADAGVTDTNYATAVAKTAVNPAAQSSTAPATLNTTT